MVRIAGRKERVIKVKSKKVKRVFLLLEKKRGAGVITTNAPLPLKYKIMKLVLHIGIFQNTRTYEEKQRFPRFTTKESLNSV